MRMIPSLFVLGTMFTAHVLTAQQPTVLHAQLSTVTAEHELVRQVDGLKKSGAQEWIGYAIAVGPGFHSGSSGSISFLENVGRYEDHGPYPNAAYDHVNVLMRVEGGQIERLRLETPDRQLDAGGLRFVWIDGVAANESIALLQSFALSDTTQKVRNDAVFFISLHQTPEANASLVRLTNADISLEVREKAAFWLANQREHEGFLAIQHLARTDTDAAFREKLAFDLTLCHEPDAVEELIHMAKTDASPRVRKQAQFWMANIGGKKVSDDLRSAAQDDPDVDVRKAAVFALSRLPGDEAASELIQVASTSHDAAIRKQAVFLLGQSQDPRALEYLTKLVQQP